MGSSASAGFAAGSAYASSGFAAGSADEFSAGFAAGSNSRRFGRPRAMRTCRKAGFSHAMMNRKRFGSAGR